MIIVSHIIIILTCQISDNRNCAVKFASDARSHCESHVHVIANIIYIYIYIYANIYIYIYMYIYLIYRH